MKYIDADRLRAEIERRFWDYGTPLHDDVVTAKVDEVLNIIDSLQQEQQELTQLPSINQETQKKGWMDYGLLISEIGLHRSNVIDCIKETKEQATEIKRNIAPHDLAILCKYLESVGAEIVLCCLQRYCMDFMFTQDEVKEILQQGQPEVDIEKDQEAIKLAEDHAFLAGADWQKEQMMKEGDEGIVRRAGPIGYITFTNEQQFNSRLKQFQDCDKVRIIIVKEEEK